MQALLGKKVGMTQIFDEKGNAIPVTVLEVGPCPVVSVFENDGGRKAQIAFEEITKKDERKVTKPIRGHYAKSGVKPHRFLREVTIHGDGEVKPGDNVTLDIFKDAHYVSVTGKSKGRGFTGVVKRHGFKGAQTMTHGTHEKFRHGGSIGMCEDPARVLKGTKMAGQYGNSTTKVLNLEIVNMFPEENLLLIKGAVPGPNGGTLLIEQSHRKEKREHKASEPKFVNPLKAAKRL